MAEDDRDAEEREEGAAAPSLLEQTLALGTMLRAISDETPGGTPSDTAAGAFLTWIAEGGPTSRAPHYFADVAENFRPQEHSNLDLTYLFDMLQSYIEIPDEPEPEAPRTFIDLPLLGG